MRPYLTLSAVIFCGFVGTGATGPFQALYAAALGASLSQVALVVGVFALVYLAYAAAPPLPGLVAAQVLRGFAFAAFTATALTLAIELAPAAARGRAAGLYATANSLAQISGGWLGGPLAATIGFRALYGLDAASVLGAALLSRAGRQAPAGASIATRMPPSRSSSRFGPSKR